MIVIVVVDQFKEIVNDQIIGNAAETALRHCGINDPTSLSIRVTDDVEIQDLNKRFRGVDKVTDVLSFEGDFDDPDLESRYLGDIVISYTQAAMQAGKRGHQPIEEIQLLVIHGVLHLMGYDHDDKKSKKEMWAFQNQILDELGLNIIVDDLDDK